MNLKEDARVISYLQYKEWRQSGVAFEQRFSTYIAPNRTLGSYIEGKKKKTKESCLVRGFWGDIIISPYLAYGIETEYEPEKTNLFKVVNMQNISNSFEIGEFNLVHYLHMIESGTDFHMKFEEEKKKEQKTKKSKSKKNKKQKVLQNIEKIDENVEEENEQSDND